MGDVILNGVDCTVINCGGCGVVHALPTVKYESCMEEGGFWTCPNGCSRGWKEGRRTREAVARERDRLKQENARLAEEVAEARRQQGRVEARLQRHKKRAAAGTCPCCKRTFANMAQHMKTKHPDYGSDNVIKLA